MFARFMPQEGKFFELFNAHAEQVVLGSKTLVNLLTVFNHSDEEAAKQCDIIDEAEDQADRIKHETMRQLHKSFITPLDREEIHQLITGLDGILDLIQDSAHTVSLYNIRHITAEAVKLSELILASAESLQKAVFMLPSMDNATEILKFCREIDQLESEADREMRGAMSRLFREEPDVRELIKYKAIYELLETVTDRCEDVANLIEGIVVENSLIGSPMEHLNISLGVLAFLVFLALAFDFMNGFHDAANAIATVVSTRVLKPHTAVMLAAVCNIAAIFIFELKVAATVGKGTIEAFSIDYYVVFGALVGAIAWNVITWYYGIPSSSSHALIGGLIGAALAKSGPSALISGGVIKTVSFILISPLLGMLLGSLMMILMSWAFRRTTPRRVDIWSRRLQLVSASAYALGHGGNDAQKTIGIIWMLLIASGVTDMHASMPPIWVVVACYTAIGLGTVFGGWRIIKLMGQKITKLRPIGGFCAQTGGAATLFFATALGIPVSTTHTITGAIVGVGSTKRLSAVRWGIAGTIVWAWILTIPCSALISAIFWYLGTLFL